MQPFDIEAFQQRVQQAQTSDDYQQLKDELTNVLESLSVDERNQLQQDFKPVWNELNSRVDRLLDELKPSNHRMAV